MTKLLVVEPMTVAASAISASRGTGIAYLTTPDPKEVWVDGPSGSSTTITIDLGTARTIDTIFLGHLRNSAAGTTWTITNGDTNAVVQAATAIRVPDVTGAFAPISHALWYGTAITARLIKLTVTRPSGSALSAGSLVIGRAFVAELGQEWGAGRQPIDTGSATALPSGGFAIVEGVRKRRFAWTFGDLSQDEADRLELIALALGETKPVLVIEDADRTAGLRSRIFYGRFERWRTYERRNRKQTRWEVAIEEWA